MTRKPTNTSYIESGAPQAIAFATVQNTSLCISADSPTKTVIADLVTVPAQVENNCFIKPKSFIKMNFFGDAAGPTTFGVHVYLNKANMVAAPASTLTFNQGPQTLDNKTLRAHTIFYTRATIAPEEHRYMKIPLYLRRLSHMTDNSFLRIVIQNFQPAAGNLYYTGYGRIRTSEG